MRPGLMGLLDGLTRVLARWPRRMVLKASGERVELLEVVETDGRRRCKVEFADGRITEVAEAELDSRLAGNAVAGVAAIVIAIAGVVAGGSGSLDGAEKILEDIAACAAGPELPAVTP
ncbi:MAG: hypothetical protein U1E14_14935 [Geminicoccaceae bacterium]